MGAGVEQFEEKKLMEWYESYYDDIYRFILFMLGDRQSCEDLVHDTFVRAYTGICRFENRSSPRTWLFSIAKHVVVDEIRKRKRKRIFTVFTGEKEIPSSFDIEQYIFNRDDVRQTLENIKKLKTEYRLVITLKKIEGCSTKEIAEILGCSDVKVRKTLSRAIAALKKMDGLERGRDIEQSS